MCIPQCLSHTKPHITQVKSTVLADDAYLERLGRGVEQLGDPHSSSGFHAELCVLGADLEGKLGREGVGHGVEGLHRGQPVVGQLSPHLTCSM